MDNLKAIVKANGFRVDVKETVLVGGSTVFLVQGLDQDGEQYTEALTMSSVQASRKLVYRNPETEKTIPELILEQLTQLNKNMEAVANRLDNIENALKSSYLDENGRRL